MEHIDPWVAMLWAIWAVGHSRVDDGAREGNFHGLTARLLLSFQEAGGGGAGGPKFYCAKNGITADSAILKDF